MKQEITFLALLFLVTSITYGQAPPQAFNYSSVIRGINGQALPNKVVSIRLTILKGGTSGTEEYQETHVDTTSQIGVINLEIGNGKAVSGTFSGIDWGADSYFLKIELDDKGGTDYDDMGVVQFLSVPYALYCGNVTDKKTSDTSNTNELQALSISNDTIFLSNGGFVKLPPVHAGTNTDEQQLSISKDTLSLTNGGSIVLKRNNNYIALLNQKGTEPPTSIVIENTLNRHIEWTRVEEGKFKGTLEYYNDIKNIAVFCSVPSSHNGIRVEIINQNEFLLYLECGLNCYCDNFKNLSIQIIQN